MGKGERLSALNAGLDVPIGISMEERLDLDWTQLGFRGDIQPPMNKTEVASPDPASGDGSSEARAAALLHLIEAFRHGDMATLQRAMAPEVTLVAEGRHPYSGTYRGYAAALAFVARTSQWIDVSSMQVEEVIPEPELTLSIVATVRPVEGRTMRAALQAEFHFDSEDRICKAVFKAKDQKALDAFLTRYATRGVLR
jgi:ketosteroid isomerase-like protein